MKSYRNQTNEKERISQIFHVWYIIVYLLLFTNIYPYNHPNVGKYSIHIFIYMKPLGIYNWSQKVKHESQASSTRNSAEGILNSPASHPGLSQAIHFICSQGLDVQQIAAAALAVVERSSSSSSLCGEKYLVVPVVVFAASLSSVF